jgi:hypothetical protein
LGHVPESAAHDFTLDDGNDNSDTVFSAPARIRDKEKVPLINNKRQQLQQQQRIQRQTHRRHLSVEQTLAGLTNAMSALHGGPGRAKPKQYADEPFSSAAAFANNATRLSDQQLESPGQHTSARRAWKIEGLPMVLENRPDSGATRDENDDDDGDESDEEESSAEYEPDDSEDVEAQTSSGIATAGGRKAGKKAGPKKKRKNKRGNNRSSVMGNASDKVKSEWEAWGAFFRPRKSHIATYIRNAVLYVILPLTGVAFLLFYFCGNPRTGLTKEDGSPTGKASISWWLLFAVRQLVTFTLALALQAFAIDFLALGTKAMLRTAGPVLTLLVVQSKGWPFICFWFAILDFAMLWGNGEFANHWGYWQNTIGLFNKSNPSGNVVNTGIHTTILKIAVSVSAIVAVKRFVIGLYLGRQTFST